MSDESKDNAQPEKGRCPCCGQYTLDKPVKVGSELLDHWLACMATGEPFSREYSLYGGKVKVQAEMPDQAVSGRVASAVAVVDGAGDDCGLSAPERQGMVNALRLFAIVLAIEFTGGHKGRFDTGAAREKAIALICGDGDLKSRLASAAALLSDTGEVSSLPTSVIVAVANAHTMLSDVLVAAAVDEDFWHGIELA